MSGEHRVNPTVKKKSNKIQLHSVSSNHEPKVATIEQLTEQTIDNEDQKVTTKNNMNQIKNLLQKIGLNRIHNYFNTMFYDGDKILPELLKGSDNYLNLAFLGQGYFTTSQRSFSSDEPELARHLFNHSQFNTKAETMIELFSLFAERLSIPARQKFILGFITQAQKIAQTRYKNCYSEHVSQEKLHSFVKTFYDHIVVKYPEAFISIPEDLQVGTRNALPFFLTLNASEFEDCIQKLTTGTPKIDTDMLWTNFQGHYFHMNLLQSQFQGWDSEKMINFMLSTFPFVNSDHFIPAMTLYKDKVTNEIIKNTAEKFNRQGIKIESIIFLIKEICGGINAVSFPIISEMVQKDKISIEKFKQYDIDIADYIFKNCNEIPMRQLEYFIKRQAKTIQFPIDFKIKRYNTILLNGEYEYLAESTEYMDKHLITDPEFKMIDVVKNFLSRVTIDFLQKKNYFESTIWLLSEEKEMFIYYQAAFDILDGSFEKMELMSQFLHDRTRLDFSTSDDELAFFVKMTEDKKIDNYMNFFNEYHDSENTIPVSIYIHFTQTQMWKHIDSLFDFSENKYTPDILKDAFVTYVNEMMNLYITNSFYTKKFIDMTNNHPIHNLLDRMIAFYKIESIRNETSLDSENKIVIASLNKMLEAMAQHFGSMFLEQADSKKMFISEKLATLSGLMGINLNKGHISNSQNMNKIKVRHLKDKIMFWRKEPEVQPSYNYMYVYLQGPQFSNEILPDFIGESLVEKKTWKEIHDNEMKVVFSTLKTLAIPVTISLKVQDLSRKIKNFAESIYEIKDGLAYEDQMFFEFAFFKDLNDILKTYQNNSKNLTVLQSTFNSVTEQEIQKNNDNCIYLLSLLEDQFNNISHNISSNLLKGGSFDMKVLEEYLTSKKNQTQT